jgi:endonuclease YncB( thermonuclease family)
MQTSFFLLLVFVTGILTALQAAQQASVQVVNVYDNGTIETISSAGTRQQVRLAGIQAISLPNQIKSATVKRLKTLILGKTVQLTTVENQQVFISLGGMDISSRLLSEGVAVIEERSFQHLPMTVQQQFISAEEHARQYRRGIWRHQQPGMSQRYHYPLWPAERLPSPVTNAPVYKPDTKY